MRSLQECRLTPSPPFTVPHSFLSQPHLLEIDMMSPRIHDFQGTDHEYITYLESLVLQATANCSPPSPARSDVRDETNDNSYSSPENPIVFVPYQPQLSEQDQYFIRPTKRKRKERRWERLMDEMISEMAAEDLWSRRRTIGLSSQAGILVALDITIHGAKSRTDPISSDADLSMTSYRSSNPVLLLLDAFATTTAALKVQEAFTTQMFFFRVFVFVSLCCVALHNGADQKLVDKIMQKCVSNSCEKNLSRLRNGALWVNRMIVELAADGLDYLAYELFVLCK